MFYPTISPEVIVGEGASYQITEAFFRFILLAKTMENGEEKDRLAKEAFLCIISTRDACRHQKDKALAQILSLCPDALNGVTDNEMVDGLKCLHERMKHRHRLVSTPELTWVAHYVRTPEAREEAEKIIYSSMIRGDSHWDKARHEHSWTMSHAVQVELIREALHDKGIGSKRKTELAREINVPEEEMIRPYFRRLLWDRHYDQAMDIKGWKEEDVFLIISSNLNAGYFTDSLELAQRFLPNRQDILDELRSIIAAF